MLTTITGGGVVDSMMAFYNTDWYKFGFWFFLFIIVKFLLPNFLVGAMTAQYMNLYDEEIEYVI